jgi:O-antigen ligase
MVTGVLIAIMLNASWLLRFLEDNPEFVTGRGRLWRYVLALLSERPLFGFGYGSVWVAEMAPVDGIYRQGWTVWATHSHNGYLEVAIGTGVVGLLVALSALIVRPLLQYAWPARKPQGRDAVLFSLLSFATLHNLTEADLLMTDRWVWVVHAIVLACAYADRRLGVRGVR